MENQLKTWRVVGAIFTIIFGSLLHFIYDWSNNNDLVGVIGAVNESTWEHLKLLFWPTLIYGLVEYFFLGNKDKNFFIGKAVSLYSGILLIIVLFYTYTGIVGTHFVLMDILIFIISVIVSQYLDYLILKSNKNFQNYASTISLVSIGILVLMFIAFTFTPPLIPLFKDPISGKYGI